MAWSTYANGRWSAKRLSTNGAGPVAINFVPKDFYFTGWVSSANQLYLAVRGERIVEIEVEPPDLDDVAGGVILSNDTTEPPATTTETLDLGYFYFDDCRSALVFVADSNLSDAIARPWRAGDGRGSRNAAGTARRGIRSVHRCGRS